MTFIIWKKTLHIVRFIKSRRMSGTCSRLQNPKHVQDTCPHHIRGFSHRYVHCWLACWWLARCRRHQRSKVGVEPASPDVPLCQSGTETFRRTSGNPSPNVRDLWHTRYSHRLVLNPELYKLRLCGKTRHLVQ